MVRWGRGVVGYEKRMNQQEQRGQWRREKIMIKAVKGITVAGRIIRHWGQRGCYSGGKLRVY